MECGPTLSHAALDALLADHLVSVHALKKRQHQERVQAEAAADGQHADQPSTPQIREINSNGSLNSTTQLQHRQTPFAEGNQYTLEHSRTQKIKEMRADNSTQAGQNSQANILATQVSAVEETSNTQPFSAQSTQNPASTPSAVLKSKADDANGKILCSDMCAISSNIIHLIIERIRLAKAHF